MVIHKVILRQGWKTKRNEKNGKFSETKRNGTEKNYKIKKRSETESHMKRNDLILIGLLTHLAILWYQSPISSYNSIQFTFQK
jgi:hypothetical protein